MINLRTAALISAILVINGILLCKQQSFAQGKTTQNRLWESLLEHDSDWYASPEAVRIADNILLYQRRSGGWPKNLDMVHYLSKTEIKELEEFPDEPASTIDNGATYTQMRFLARVIRATDGSQQKYVLSFLRGLDYLLDAQYENGGWPQFYPLRKGYYSHITFNDDAMIGVLNLLLDIELFPEKYAFVDPARIDKIHQAIQKGIDCILKTQLVVNGKLTAWCAQYDEKTLEPARARAYELVSLSGEESVGIVRFLMRIEPPTPAIKKAVHCAVQWFNDVALENIRIQTHLDPSSPTGFDREIVEDSNAPPIWARFYEIETNRPFFSDRDGKVYYDISQISKERRNKYGWLGYWPEELLKKDYPIWRKKWIKDDQKIDCQAGHFSSSVNKQ